MAKRFYETDSKLTGLKVIIDRQGEYTFSPLTHEQNHMFLKALNNLDSPSLKNKEVLNVILESMIWKDIQHNRVMKSLGMSPVIGTPRDERWWKSYAYIKPTTI